MAENNLPCWVYRSPRKQEMYLYLAQEDGFDTLPAALLERFGEPILVIELELSSERELEFYEVLVTPGSLLNNRTPAGVFLRNLATPASGISIASCSDLP